MLRENTHLGTAVKRLGDLPALLRGNLPEYRVGSLTTMAADEDLFGPWVDRYAEGYGLEKDSTLLQRIDSLTVAFASGFPSPEYSPFHEFGFCAVVEGIERRTEGRKWQEIQEDPIVRAIIVDTAVFLEVNLWKPLSLSFLEDKRVDEHVEALTEMMESHYDRFVARAGIPHNP